MMVHQTAPMPSLSQPNLLSAQRRNAWLAASATPLLLGTLWVAARPLGSIWPDATAAATVDTFAGFVLLAMLAVASWTDLRRHKIPNWITYPAFVWALVINASASIWHATAPATSLVTVQAAGGESLSTTVGPAMLGAIGIAASLAGAAVCGGAMLIAYNLARGGAGDVKLAIALGALLGVGPGLTALAFAYLIAGGFIVCYAIWTQGPLVLCRAFGRQIGALLVPMWVAPPNHQQRQLLNAPVPLAVFFALGTLPVLAGVEQLV